ncbi:ATP-binding protein [Paracraurococcus ruber]|uniref:histidine kinase n=1 Tax=Paracraurococcus ruber TaxID=77675 RepID=A0ABS1D128_9PROT|nr:ATP-binding protein [Paracraurococcus ruber]MBK1660509.1 two-component sensor histidine kinase [Paracraurococcus ruber]TDG29367.1 HAMP domain-containing protein [Paracraurococcus ruber]
MRRAGNGRRLGRVLRGLLPRGLLGRSVLIILVPMVVLQAVALQLFYGGHLDVISRRLAGGVAGDVAMLVELVRREEPENRAWIFRESLWKLDLALAYEEGARLQFVARPASLPLLPLEEDLNTALWERLRLPFDTDWQSDPRSVIIRVQLPEGVLHVEAPRKRLFSATLYLFVIWLVGSALLLSGVAIVFMKNQVRALRRLADAAEAFGLGRDIGAIKPEGASEVRQAGMAFNRMQERIRRFVGQRTEMLAGISHDLRTPLTRMRLAIAMLPRGPEVEEDLAALTQDVEEMERMTAAYLSFARGEGTEQSRPADLVELVRDVAANARRTGAAVEVAAPEALTMPLRPDAVRRCLGNLIDNAGRHARRIAVGVRTVPRAGEAGPGGVEKLLWAEVTVDDDGPGIPAAEREGAFRPFHSGSPDGTGLGLAIARDIVRAHGGDIALEESPLGGLRARLRLPV